MVYQIIAVFLIIACLDVREFLQTNSNKFLAIMIYSLLLLSGLCLSYLLAVDKAPTSPAVIIDKIIDLILRR